MRAAFTVPDNPDEKPRYKTSLPSSSTLRNTSAKRSGVTWLVVGIAPARIMS